MNVIWSLVIAFGDVSFCFKPPDVAASVGSSSVSASSSVSTSCVLFLLSCSFSFGAFPLIDAVQCVWSVGCREEF